MSIPLYKLFPLMVMATIGHHSRGAIKERMHALSFSPSMFVAKQSMKNIIYAVRLHTIGEGIISIEGDGSEFIRQVAESDAGDPAVDPWGTNYRLSIHGVKILIVSAGPDKEFSTEDDLQRWGALLVN